MAPPAEETVAEVAPEVTEPAVKKAKGDDGEAVPKTGWENYTMNVAEAVVIASEGEHLSTIADGPVSALQGIGPEATKVADVLGIKTVRELAQYKYFKMARAITTLAATEVEGKRPATSVMNLDKAVSLASRSSHRFLETFLSECVCALANLLTVDSRTPNGTTECHSASFILRLCSTMKPSR